MRLIVLGQAALVAIAIVLLGAVAAAETVFFGEDINRREEGTTNNDTLRIAHPIADAARASFMSYVPGIGAETIELFAPNSAPSSLTFNATTATISPPLTVLSVPSGTLNGAYPVSGNQFLLQNVAVPTSFAISFTSPQAAFGFYATDVEVPGNLSLRFLLADGITTLDRPVPSQAGSGGLNNTGSVLYYGLIDATNPFIKVTFVRPLNSNDGFAFDDLSVGSVLLGDYNGNGTVDAADYVVWRENDGTNNVLLNNAIGGMIGQAHYDQWRSHFGQSSGSGAALPIGEVTLTTVPEPTTLDMLLVGIVALPFRRRAIVP